MPLTADNFASESRWKGFTFITKWIDCGIILVKQLLGLDEYLIYKESKAKFHNVDTDFLLYECVIFAIKCYQKSWVWNGKMTLILMILLSGNVC